MNKIIKQYTVSNGNMDPEFRLSEYGMARLPQDCFCALVAQHYLAAFDLRKRGLMWIISEFTMKMSGEKPFWGEDVEVELWLSEPPRIKVMMDYRITYKGREIMSGNSAWAILDTATRKPANASEIMKDVPVFESLALGYRRFVFPASGEKLLDFTHVPTRGETDFNYHVTNLAYFGLCMDAMPDDYSRSHSMRFFSIRFLQESFLGETLTCTVNRADGAGVPEGMDSWNYAVASDSGKVCIRANAQYSDLVQQVPVEDIDLKIRKI